MTKPPMKPTSTKTADVPPVTDVAPATDATLAVAIPTEAPKSALQNIESLSDKDIEATLKQLRTELRRRESAREASRPKVGSKVRILRGRPKYVGKEGTAVVVRKSRCFVAVAEISSPAYVLISDVEVLER